MFRLAGLTGLFKTEIVPKGSVTLLVSHSEACFVRPFSRPLSWSCIRTCSPLPNAFSACVSLRCKSWSAIVICNLSVMILVGFGFSGLSRMEPFVIVPIIG